jgi:hypothetical protein
MEAPDARACATVAAAEHSPCDPAAEARANTSTHPLHSGPRCADACSTSAAQD